MTLKQSIQNDYLLRVNKAQNFISRNLDRCITLKEIADASFFSEYHFHRIFNSILGETVNNYVSRKRLERAANMLAYSPHYNLLDISSQCGFSSQSNFSKAVKDYFGYTPSQFRNTTNEKNCKVGKITSKYGKFFSPKDMYPSLSLDSVLRGNKEHERFITNVEIRDIKKEISLVFITSSNGRENMSTCKAWEKLQAWTMVNIKSSYQSTNAFGLCHDNPLVTPIEKCRYDASIEIEPDIDVKSPFFKTSIPSGKYAVVHYKGPVGYDINIYRDLYSVLLINSGYTADNYPVVERYFTNPTECNYIELEICIKIKPVS